VIRVLLATPYSPTGRHEHAAADLARPLATELSGHVELFVYSPSQPARAQGSDADRSTYLAGHAPGLGARRHWCTRPGWLRKEWTSGATAEVLAYMARLQPDVLHCEYLQAAEPVLGARRPSVVTLHDFSSDVQRGLLSTSRGARRLYRRAELVRTESFERRVLAKASVVIALSPADQRTFSRHADNVMLARPGIVVPDRRWAGPRLGDGAPCVLFFGALWRSANVEIVRFLVDSVMPLVWAQRPGVSLRIAGARPGAEIHRIAGCDGRVHVIGYVDDVEVVMSEASLVLAPNRVGGGVLLKVLRSLAVGCPVVTSPDAAAAIGARHNTHLLVGDGPQELAGGVLRLLAHPTVAERIGAAGRTLVEDRFAWGQTVTTYLAAYQQAADS
jgi:glycosyltransferase involved in cell wall biosynthesis